MTSRSKRSLQPIELDPTGYSSPEFPVAREEFNELKQTMQGILKRLDILEQVFVFVDIDQINQVLEKYSANQKDKAGKTGFGFGQWEAILESRSKSPTDSGSSDSRTHSCDAQRNRESWESSSNRISSPVDAPPQRKGMTEGLREDVHDLPREDFNPPSPPRDITSARPPKRLPPLQGPDTPTSELRYREWDGLSNATDDHDRKSSCSTWDLCSTRSGWNDEAEVDPNVFKKFMNQALKPKWESKPQDAILVQNVEDDQCDQEAHEATASTAYWSQLMGNSKPSNR